ncbi:MAG: hypothetical protein WCR01_10620 [Bacteroidota bacterium]
MKVVRPIEINVDKEIGTINVNNVPLEGLHLHAAVNFYHEKTKHLSDDEFKIWLLNRMKDGLVVYEDDRNNMMEYLNLKDYSLATHDDYTKIGGLRLVLDLMVNKNEFFTRTQPPADRHSRNQTGYEKIPKPEQKRDLDLGYQTRSPEQSYKSFELVVPFPKTEFMDDGTHIPTNKFIMELQHDWEESFYNRFKPYYANTIEGHPSAMLRLTKYMDVGEETDYDFGMELIDGKIDIDTNLEIEKYSKYRTVYAIGSQLHDDEDEPIILIKNDSLGEDILVLKYTPDYDEDENSIEKSPVRTEKLRI